MIQKSDNHFQGCRLMSYSQTIPTREEAITEANDLKDRLRAALQAFVRESPYHEGAVQYRYEMLYQLLNILINDAINMRTAWRDE